MKRTLALVLAVLLMITSVTVLLTSCSKEEEKKPVTSNNKVEVEGEEGDIFWERAQVKDDIGDHDFGEKELRVVTHDSSDFFVKEEDVNKGNLMVDAYAERTKKVEERFNFKLVLSYKSDYQSVRDYVIKTVTSGSDEFDLFCSHTASAGNIVIRNVFLNWYDIPHVDFTKPWWPELNRTQLTYDGKCMLAVSDFSFNATRSMQCIYFNKSLANAYDLGNLYDVVNEGKWTYDYFYNLIKDIYIDEDGDGEKSAGDFYGLAQPGNTPLAVFITGFNNPSVIINSEGEPEDVLKTDKIFDIIDTLINHCHNTPGVYFVPVSNNGAYTDSSENPINLFYSGKAIFGIMSLGSTTSSTMRNFADDYGILPIPKWDEKQDKYYTTGISHFSSLAVPKTCKDTEFVGACVEGLTAETWKIVTPTFYEIALKTRYLRDDESKEVLDYIINGREFTFGKIYGGEGLFAGLTMQLVERQQGRFQSWYNSRKYDAKNQIKKVVKAFNDLD